MKILVVEDDPDFLDALVDILSGDGHDVRTAPSGNKAKTILLENSDIELVISDYYMPDGDGRSLLQFIRERDPRVPPFFVLTGQSDTSREELKALGAQEYISKPFDVSPFLSMVRHYG